MFSSLKKFIPQDKKEKELALRISGLSFIVFMGILGTIIFSSYIYQMDRLRWDFLMESRIFEGWWNPNRMQEMIHNSINEHENISPRKHGERGPRDIIILNHQNQILKNDLFDLDDSELSLLIESHTGIYENIDLDDRDYIIYKSELQDYTVIFVRDITTLREFHIRLVILALIASNLAFIIIYLLSGYLARITIQPIREHNESLEAYNRNVAHELKTPLAIMRSNLELLRIKPEWQFIDSTNEEIEWMEKIIETLLFLAKPDKTHTDIENIDIGVLIKNILEEYHNDTIQLNISKNTFHIQGNRELLKRVIMNLIDNALKYKSDWDISIHIDMRSIEVTNQIEQDIDKHTLQKLTEAFYQADTSRHTNGQWLGLALVKKIVDLSGWELILESNENNFSAKIEF
jgi:two-component system sensor histidine kinase CiaH